MFAWFKDALRQRQRQQALEYLETLAPWLRDDLGLDLAKLRTLKRPPARAGQGASSARTRRRDPPVLPFVFYREAAAVNRAA